MASIIGLVNRLLPFATPGTPLLQDLVHLGAICTILYYAPQIQHWAQERQNQPAPAGDDTVGDATPAGDVPDAPHEEDAPRDNAREFNDAADQHAPVDDFENAQFNNPAEENANEHIREGQAGPAGPANTPAHRNVGAKKAKSLARKDQRRAYNEFMRSQGDAQRAEEAKGAAEREAVVEAKKAKEREQKREAERKQREEEMKSRELAIRLVREALDDEGLCDLFKVARQVGGDADEEWVERILRASDLVGLKDGVLTMITSVGWAARVSQQDVRQLYENAATQDVSDESGAIGYDRLGSMFETILRERAVTA
jgi:hypothetical protein